jgi:hypothetical protein
MLGSGQVDGARGLELMLQTVEEVTHQPYNSTMFEIAPA